MHAALAGLCALVAVGARWSFEEAYHAVDDGQWYIGHDNETATLAWGESYVVQGLAAMFRATGHPMYLDRMARHLDSILVQRDDARGVTDYRGVSAACWRNLSYQDEPYCYVVHSGILAEGLAAFAVMVRDAGLEAELAADGESFGDKATAYLVAAEESVAAHDDQWNAAGYWVFRPDATFLANAGVDIPLNQSNAMGRALVLLHDLTGEPEYLAKVTALAARMRAQMTTAASGALVWNYWGGTYQAPGEDVSHAAINLDFALMAAERGIVFTPEDVERLARTFVEHVYVDDSTMSNFVGGGATNGGGYRPQVGRWLKLAAQRNTVYTAVRDLYEADYPPASIGSGSLLFSWGLLAEFEPRHCLPFFYLVDWDDLGDQMHATAYGANILTTPYDLSTPCIVPVEVHVPRTTEVQQWDGATYHRVATWRPTTDFERRFVPYEPSWPHVYWDDGVLFQFADAFVEGAGIRVRKAPEIEFPAITSTPPSQMAVGTALAYAPTATGDAPSWWSLAIAPAGARIDPATGAIDFVATAPGILHFEVVLENDYGADLQSFDVEVVTHEGDTGSATSTGDGHTDEGDGPGTSGPDAATQTSVDTAPADTDTGGCGCTAPRRPAPAWLFASWLFVRRRRVSSSR